MNELIMPHNAGVKRVLESMKEVLALYKNVTGNYRPMLDGERYLTDREVAEILKVSRRTLQEYRNDGILPYILLGGKVLVAVDDLQRNVHQLHLEGDVGLVTLADNPLVTVDVHDVVRRQVLHVDEREGGEAHEYKNVTNKGEIVVLELHIEQNVKSTSHVSYSFFNFGCKTTISFGIHRYAKCSSLRNKNGLRFGNLTPSPILPNLLFDPN